uniref:Kinetochore protein NDC80 n=1 Tax=Dracunculus medinensis TaxID=318479 RepID=A0A0N4UIE6_DRAME
LINSGYQFSSNDALRNVTRKEFGAMFEFIVQQLDPNYKLNGKLEEIPKFFHDFGYPVVIKLSTMQTIGAAHTMPHLYGALSWLIDAIEENLEMLKREMEDQKLDLEKLQNLNDHLNENCQQLQMKKV